MAKNGGKTEYYKKYKLDRDRYTKAILESNSHKKVVIAGPGTGKSRIFEAICEKNIASGKKKNLTLTFINELVDGLAKDLHKLSDVKTLHSFARSSIKGHDKYHLKLEEIINEDYKIIFGKKTDFNDILCNLVDDKEAIKFYFRRRKYYEHYSPNSTVYVLVKHFQKNRIKIPEYSQILIDEYQDFNKLESTLIDLLSVKSPVLIVGDDDQSLYGWKHANPEEIRLKNKSSDYESFQLPYCSRSTKVIIDTFKCIVDKAKKRGLLKKRLNKSFEYFPSEEKDSITDTFPRVSVKRKVYRDSVAFHIDSQIKGLINPKHSDKYSVLVITPFREQVQSIEKTLIKKGYRNIRTRMGIKRDDLLEGYNLLLRDHTCNLGWRIVSKSVLSKDEFNTILIKSYKSDGRRSFVRLLDLKKRKRIKSILATLRKIKEGKDVDEEKLMETLDCLDYYPLAIAKQKLQHNLGAKNIRKNTHKDILIQVTTVQGSKGLEGDLVFLVNFDKRFVYKNNESDITDEVVCGFLVALTRTRDKLFIYSSDKNLPAFVDWLEEGMYEED